MYSCAGERRAPSFLAAPAGHKGQAPRLRRRELDEISSHDISCGDISRSVIVSSPSEAVFQILLSLSDQPRHGLGIAEEVEARTRGRVRLGASTLYTALRRLRTDRWVQETSADAGEDPRRRFYALTDTGRQVLEDEARRLDSWSGTPAARPSSLREGGPDAPSALAIVSDSRDERRRRVYRTVTGPQSTPSWQDGCNMRPRPSRRSSSGGPRPWTCLGLQRAR